MSAEMNYFGHAGLAWEKSRDTAFVFGAMLPDLAAMVACSMPVAQHSQVRDGVTFHHKTDALFHSTEAFVKLNRAALATLRNLGVRRGPARAAAHLGTELLLDGLLIKRPMWCRGYLATLEDVASTSSLREGFSSAEDIALTKVVDVLRERGANIHAITRERLEFRLQRSLGGRRLLEPTPNELELISGVLVSHQVAVNSAIPLLLDELSSLLQPQTATDWSLSD